DASCQLEDGNITSMSWCLKWTRDPNLRWKCQVIWTSLPNRRQRRKCQLIQTSLANRRVKEVSAVPDKSSEHKKVPEVSGDLDCLVSSDLDCVVSCYPAACRTMDLKKLDASCQLEDCNISSMSWCLKWTRDPNLRWKCQVIWTSLPNRRQRRKCQLIQTSLANRRVKEVSAVPDKSSEHKKVPEVSGDLDCLVSSDLDCVVSCYPAACRTMDLKKLDASCQLEDCNISSMSWCLKWTGDPNLQWKCQVIWTSLPNRRQRRKCQLIQTSLANRRVKEVSAVPDKSSEHEKVPEVSGDLDCLVSSDLDCVVSCYPAACRTMDLKKLDASCQLEDCNISSMSWCLKWTRDPNLRW